jgi:hypothetical protein
VNIKSYLPISTTTILLLLRRTLVTSDCLSS